MLMMRLMENPESTNPGCSAKEKDDKMPCAVEKMGISSDKVATAEGT